MHYQILPRGSSTPNDRRDAVYLTVDLWNDYSFITMFFAEYRDSSGQLHQLGQTKIGFAGQTTERPSYKELPEIFSSLSAGWISVGQDVDFYKRAHNLPDNKGIEIISGLRDLVVTPKDLDTYKDEAVLNTSLLRSVSAASIKNQFSRVLHGSAERTPFHFAYTMEGSNGFDDVNMDFNVIPFTAPSTNIHAIIGRNGVGKTTILNSMIKSLIQGEGLGKFSRPNKPFNHRIDEEYFSNLVSVSFSAFDPFTPPIEQTDPAKGTCYYYVGLKDPHDQFRLRTIEELRIDCCKALLVCFSNKQKHSRWASAIRNLSSDDVFGAMDLPSLHKIYLELVDHSPSSIDEDEFYGKAEIYLKKMSSGHAVVFYTVAKLVSTVEEKTLVLIDEPESHLHPPLLSAFVRTLAELLHDRNGVSLIATHSPVVLQEIPKSCVWKVHRVDTSIKTLRPKIETFGESVGLLTSEVFGLEVSRSGFHDLLRDSVQSGKTYDEIVDEYRDQIGFEGKAVLTALLEGIELEGASREEELP